MLKIVKNKQHYEKHYYFIDFVSYLSLLQNIKYTLFDLIDKSIKKIITFVFKQKSDI